MLISIQTGDAVASLRATLADSVHCCGTRPQYWGLRDYGTLPQIWGGRPRLRAERHWTLPGPDLFRSLGFSQSAEDMEKLTAVGAQKRPANRYRCLITWRRSDTIVGATEPPPVWKKSMNLS